MAKGKKADMGHPYYKVGRLKQSIARKIHVKCADIYISENYIKHINKNHKKELEQLGISAFNFVKFVVTNFNQIRKGRDGGLYLVVYNENYSNVAVIQLVSLQNEFWEVKTAQPRKSSDINKKVLLWRTYPRFK
ncbi:MAG: hypothetical protein GX793_01520 [Bacteroidales bacterium]|jgi:hypothetical protein|nr:hypothetical protein [Bacteroidales bacterium]MCK9499959.1 hypothetical protein [Bacteroidales bacterium]MDY0315660.1 hypothetical protein [Bacteroidales bacterium]NLB85718.1 hypothetical protein [Bacteroidales bacterium]